MQLHEDGAIHLTSTSFSPISGTCTFSWNFSDSKPFFPSTVHCFIVEGAIASTERVGEKNWVAMCESWIRRNWPVDCRRDAQFMVSLYRRPADLYDLYTCGVDSDAMIGPTFSTAFLSYHNNFRSSVWATKSSIASIGFSSDRNKLIARRTLVEKLCGRPICSLGASVDGDRSGLSRAELPPGPPPHREVRLQTLHFSFHF